MKSISLFFIAFIVCTTISKAQSYSLSWQGEPIGESETESGLSTDIELEFLAVLKNNTEDTVNIKVERTIIDLLDGTVHLFCWGICYPPNTDSAYVSPLPVSIPPGEYSDDYEFSGHYKPNGVEGSSIIKYTFFNVDDYEEQVSVTVTYTASVVSGFEEMDSFKLKMYPNPASKRISIESNFKIERLEIYNQVGQLIDNMSTATSLINLNVSDLETGIYLVKIFSHNNVITRKLVIE